VSGFASVANGSAAPYKAGPVRRTGFGWFAVDGEVPERSIGTVSKTVVLLRVPRVRIPPSPPVQNRTGHAERKRLHASGGGERLKQTALRADDADLAIRDLDALCKRDGSRRLRS
jgi:hypothetical protein